MAALQITPLPAAPSRNSSATTFSITANTFVAALPQFVSETNTLSTDLVNQANIATAQANAAIAAVNATAWVSGKVYNVGDPCYSPLTFQIYKNAVAGATTTDPSLDTTTWVKVSNSNPARPYLRAVETYAQGTGMTATTITASSLANKRALNSLVSNNIPGASLSSGIITLPKGTYYLEGNTVAYDSSTTATIGVLAVLINTTSNSVALQGLSGYTNGKGGNMPLNVTGKLVLAATTTFALGIAASSTGLNSGFASNIPGLAETYATLEVWKED